MNIAPGIPSCLYAVLNVTGSCFPRGVFPQVCKGVT